MKNDMSDQYRYWAEKCAGFASLKSEQLDSEKMMETFREHRASAVTDNERSVYDFMLSEEQEKYDHRAREVQQIIRSIYSIRHPDARRVLSQYYLDGRLLKEIRDEKGIPYGLERAKYYKRLGLKELVDLMEK